MDIRSQQRQLLWGNSKPVDFVVGGTAVTLPAGGQSTGQLVRVETDEPVAWLVQMFIDASGFAGEANPINVQLLTSMGIGQMTATQEQSFSLLTPAYAQVFDQGQICATQLSIQALVTGGPFTVPGDHRVTVSLGVAPISTENAKLIEELRAMRGDIAQLCAALRGGR